MILDGLAQHNFRLIVLPREKVTSGDSKPETFYYQGKKFKRYEWFSYHPGFEEFPGGMFLLALGRAVTKKEIMKEYPKTHSFYFFIVEESDLN